MEFNVLVIRYTDTLKQEISRLSFAHLASLAMNSSAAHIRNFESWLKAQMVFHPNERMTKATNKKHEQNVLCDAHNLW